ncbi:hypothetical protein [Flavobacterium humi]|uniref:Uncharacterized protein n=1 Tax=Flavobacterium humi TaxID=2562683 RepID=A0A4Z0LBI0_9FLAO|nr:hypothetical protein [Flavobacterium humi]TGD59136.1 hypothetical protein E4635_04600 [Flavobacterium humi]
MSEECKIWFPHEIFYIESLLSITRTILSEKNVVVTVLDQIQEGDYENGKILIDAVQNICTQAALISKFFWPVSRTKIHKGRGKRLREAYGIHEQNCLKDKQVRNFIEHFDEKLDLYLSEFTAGTIIPIYVGPRIDMEAKQIFRGYFLNEAVFTILHLEYKIIPIIDEIERIHLLLEQDFISGRFSN